MNRRILRLAASVLIGLLVITGGIWILTQALASHETRYQNKGVYEWETQLLSGDTAASNQAHTVVINQILPHLTEVMFHDTNDSSLRISLVEKLNNLPGVNIVFTDASARRAEAATSIGQFESAAEPAVPALIQALKGSDDAVRAAALTSLGKIHCQPDVVLPLLISYLDNQELNTHAAEGLGYFGPAAKPALPKLLPLLEVRDKDLHHAVVEALKKITSASTEATGAK
jgi:hypothetical protein